VYKKPQAKKIIGHEKTEVDKHIIQTMLVQQDRKRFQNLLAFFIPLIQQNATTVNPLLKHKSNHKMFSKF